MNENNKNKDDLGWSIDFHLEISTDLVTIVAIIALIFAIISYAR